MEKMGWKRQWRLLLFAFWLGISSQLSFAADFSAQNSTRRILASKMASSPPVKLHINRQHVVMDNGLVQVTLSNPVGKITGIRYNGIDNILEYHYQEGRRGYWDIVWSRPDEGASHFDMLEATSFKVVAKNDDKVEISFTKNWNPSRGDDNGLPLNVDKRFIMLRGTSGFYSYAIFDHLEGWPALNIDEARIAFKLQQNLFHYMVVSDDRQRIMPSYQDRVSGKILDYKEAVLLKNPANPQLKGEVDDKYQYSTENKDNRVHGWICSQPRTGFWVITPSDEFRTGGPVKQDLTSHSGPTSLAIFFSNHYAGPDMRVSLADGEAWKKVFGPVFIYLNSDSSDNSRALWEDAKKQMLKETRNWPYDFPLAKDYPHANQRSMVSGRLKFRDRYISKEPMSAKSAYVGLAPMGDAGSWQKENKGYQFWNQSDEHGFFTIKGVRPGSYNLYAFIPGVLGDYKYNVEIEIKPGDEIKLGDLEYEAPRHGPTIWEIGIPDRTAAEFYVPDPSPKLMNPLYCHKQKFRQYGLWDRYTDLYPHKDLVYSVGKSNYKTDWFFAHVNRRAGNKTYVPTTWEITFDLGNVIRTGTYKLRLALASATYAKLQVWINNPNTPRPVFATGRIGRDNAIARHGIHGIYWLYNVDISGSGLVNGRNTIFLRQANGAGPFTGLMYDYIRLEGPPEAK